MTARELWCYEARRCGWISLALPLAVAGLLWVQGLWTPWRSGAGLALVVGLCMASLASAERMAELQLTLPTALSRTMWRRWSLLLAAALAAEAVVAWAVTGEWGAAAFAVVLAGIGAWAGVTLRSAAGASTVVIAAWLATLLVLERLLPDPVSRAVALLLVTVPVFALATRRLADGERLIDPEPQ